MVNRSSVAWAGCVIFSFHTAASAQDAGSIRGMVYDRDFDAPLPAAKVSIAETGQSVTGSDGGNYVLSDVPPGMYTLVFAKPGYAQQVRSGVVVTAGELTDVDVYMSGDFTDMEEFVVQDFQIGGGTEAGLLQLRLEAPALIDSISTDFMSRAGASDAADALNYVAGATVSEGKFAVIRGLPDRFVSTQMNGVRLPTADEDKRAVELDQFPAAVIESIQISKTFTPDQQGDASGGAVDVVLKSIPDENLIQFKSQIGFNSQVSDRTDFLTYTDGGLNFLGNEDGSRTLPGDADMDGLLDFMGAAGTSRGQSPTDYKWSVSAGGSHELDSGVRIGGFASFFYERDSSFFDNGVDDSLWVEQIGGGPLVPQRRQDQGAEDFKTALFDVERATQLVQWGALGTAGIETDKHALNLTYLYTRTAEDTATLAEDTRGKAFFFEGYDVNDPMAEGNAIDNRGAAPYLRTQTLEYTERTTETLQFSGRHTLPADLTIPLAFPLSAVFDFSEPVLDWTIAKSEATLYQPDKRQFGSEWAAPSFRAGSVFPIPMPPSIDPARYVGFKPAANFTLGNFQRIFKSIEEESDQYSVNLKMPFEQWSDDPGYLKFGIFNDEVRRSFDQETFSNFNDNTSFLADFDTFWSSVFPFEDGHDVTAGPPFVDVDYRGKQSIAAQYLMMDLPLNSWFNVIGGVRFEETRIGINNFPEEDSKYFPAGATGPVNLDPPDIADVDFQQRDILPSIGFVFAPRDDLTVRASYAQTVARQTFKELAPVQQQEFLGSDIFVGNPDLQMAALQNYDVRVDFTPYPGGLISASYFHKDIENSIEIVQRLVGFTVETPVNFPSADLSGIELEIRQQLGEIWEPLTGLGFGANATIIDSEVRLSEEERQSFLTPNILTPMSTRDMTDAPEYLYNLYLTFDSPDTGTQASLFYTVKGDTLIAGAGQANGKFVPSVYAEEFGALNFTISQKLGDVFKLTFQAKNLTNPTIREVYRSDFITSEQTRRSFTKGIEYTIGLSAEFRF